MNLRDAQELVRTRGSGNVVYLTKDEIARAWREQIGLEVRFTGPLRVLGRMVIEVPEEMVNGSGNSRRGQAEAAQFVTNLAQQLGLKR
jgi:hypothetical protein